MDDTAEIQDRNTEQRKRDREALAQELREMARRVSALPVLDDRTEDEILGYDENGIPEQPYLTGK